jgi:hypothetical protein
LTQPQDFWERAIKAISSAKLTIEVDFDGAASRAYYAAFYAVSALFAMEDKTFKRHSNVESAVHNDLVRTGRWPVDLGKAYSFLRETRTTGDYGGDLHVSEDDALKALNFAQRILVAVHNERPEIFLAAWEI